MNFISQFGRSQNLLVISNRFLFITNKMSDITSVFGNFQMSEIVGICNLNCTSDIERNFNHVKTIFEKARSYDVRFLFLPEGCDFIANSRSETVELAEPIDGQLMQRYKNLAKEFKMWVSLGGIHEAVFDSNGKKKEKIFNSHVILNDDGELVSVYRKLHLFDTTIGEKKFAESEMVYKGLSITPPVQTPIGKIGLGVCYDLRFPELSTILRKMGAEILTYPSAFSYATGKDHWEVLLRARAIENQCFVVASAQEGYHNDKRRSYGEAMVVDPWGKVIAKCSPKCDFYAPVIDRSYLYEVRMQMHCFNHRRDDVYSLASVAIAEDVKIYGRVFGHQFIRRETIFYESQYSFAFTNIRCVVPGHVLVASKRRVERLLNLSSNEITDIFHTAIKVQKYLETFYKATAGTVTIQDGKDAGQTIKHVHIHIMPRHKEDFKCNDEIYMKLQSHDHDPKEERRSLEDMKKEAQEYRDFIQKSINEDHV